MYNFHQVITYKVSIFQKIKICVKIRISILVLLKIRLKFPFGLENNEYKEN